MDARGGCWFYRSTEFLIACVIICTCSAHSYDRISNLEDLSDLSTSEVLRLRGYLAEDHTVCTQDGYALNLVEAYNPLINYTNNPALVNKEAVLFIHGTLFNATGFISHAPVSVEPKDFSRLNASKMSPDKLIELYDGSPNVESLVFMLLDFGHKIFLLNRRNTIASRQAYDQKHVVSADEDDQSDDGEHVQTGARSLFDLDYLPWNPFSAQVESFSSIEDESYWNFSLDEMAKYDLPDTIEYILRLIKRNSLAALGWSSGGAIIEMGLSTQPILNEKISKSLLWSPSLYLGSSWRNKLFFILGEPFLSRYIGPFPPKFISDIFITLAKLFCNFKFTSDIICQWPMDFFGGYGGDQRLLVSDRLCLIQIADNKNPISAPVSSHEFAQLGQISINKKSHFYNFGRTKNLIVYGSSKPPLYDASKITSTGLYFWGAEYDGLVDIEDVASNVNDLSVEAVFTRLDQPDLYFEHFSYLWHKNRFQLLYIPSLRILES